MYNQKYRNSNPLAIQYHDFVHVHKTKLQFSVVSLVNKAKLFENFHSLRGRVGFITGENKLHYSLH